LETEDVAVEHFIEVVRLAERIGNPRPKKTRIRKVGMLMVQQKLGGCNYLTSTFVVPEGRWLYIMGDIGGKELSHFRCRVDPTIQVTLVFQTRRLVPYEAR
jgi:hypothetical protein